MSLVFGVRPVATKMSVASTTCTPFGVSSFSRTRSAGPALDAADLCVQPHVNALVPEQVEKCVGSIGIFAAGELRTSLDDRYLRAKATGGLRELEPDVTSA
jgi:hypothetical protein